jgi:hypothetical protein
VNDQKRYIKVVESSVLRLIVLLETSTDPGIQESTNIVDLHLHLHPKDTQTPNQPSLNHLDPDPDPDPWKRESHIRVRTLPPILTNADERAVLHLLTVIATFHPPAGTVAVGIASTYEIGVL